MTDFLITATLLAGFVYVLLLATNPRGAWQCPVCNLFSRVFRSTRRGQGAVRGPRVRATH